MSVTRESLNSDPILGMAGVRDPLGVLTLMTSPRPGSRHAAAAAAGPLRRAIEALAQNPTGRAPEDATAALRRRRDEADALLDTLLDPTRGGRGRVALLPLSGAPIRVDVWAELPDTATLAGDAHVAPLLVLREGGRPVGLIAVSGRRMAVAESAWGEVHGVHETVFRDESGEWRRFEGPARGGTGRGTESYSQADLFATRVEAHRRADLAGAAGTIADEARTRGWVRAVVCGEPALAEAVAEPLAAAGVEVVRSAVTPGDGWSPRELADALGPERAAAAATARSRLMESAMGAAQAHGGRGALGVDDVLSALVEGRVHHLVLVPEALPDQYEQLPDGRLAAVGEVPAGPLHGRLRRLHGLCDRMVAEAVQREADVTALTAGEAPELAAEGGVAAILRW